MKLLVVGAGATGGYFGALALRGGAEVTMLARRAHGEAMRAHGLRVVDPGGEFTVRPRVVASLEELAAERFDIVLVTVKMGDLAPLLPAAAALVAPGGALITAQNGVEAEELAAPHVPPEQLVGAILIIGASMPEPGVVQAAGFRAMVLGAPTAAALPTTRRVVAELTACGVPASLHDDLAVARWSKLCWNNAFNSLTALTGLTCRQAVRDPGVKALATAAMREVEAVARAQGVALPANIVDTCLGQAETVGDVKTSTLQDVLAGRALEHDALCGVIVRRGAALGIPTPVNGMLHPLLAAISSRAR